MSDDFDISQKETVFTLPKQGNLALFAPVNKLARLAYLRGSRTTHSSYVIRPERLPRTTVRWSERNVFITFEIFIFFLQKRMDLL